ncbi:MAG TPA: hypothetical protein EYG74_08630 [Sulfurimonas autotrophica]|nr:hypothetical protein [Sulfurimonas autotrophica]
MKKSLVLAGLLAISSSAYAMDVNYFIAVGGGKGYETVNVNVAGVTESVSDNGGVFSIDTGVLLNDTHRIGLEYSKYNTTGSSSLYSIGLGYNYRIHIKDSKFKPFVGMSYAILKYSEDMVNDASVTWDQSTYNITTKALLGSIGVDYDINKNLYASMRYDYALSTSGSTDIGLTVGGTHYTGNAEFDKFSQLQLLIGYKF